MTELVRVEGLKELRTALLKTVPAHMQGPTLQRALAAGARPIIQAAKALAPFRTGVLKRAIFSFRDKGSTPTYEARNIRPRQGKKFQKSGRDAFYWRFIEFGHRTGARKGQYLAKEGRRSRGKSVAATGVVPPQPFLRPAFQAQAAAALKVIVERLQLEIEKAAAKAHWRSSADSGAKSAQRGISDLGGFFDRFT